MGHFSAWFLYAWITRRFFKVKPELSNTKVLRARNGGDVGRVETRTAKGFPLVSMAIVLPLLQSARLR